MKHSTFYPASGDANLLDATSSTTSSVQTITLPGNCSAFLLSVATTDARMTFNGSTPSATNGHVIPAGQMPALFLLGPGCTINFTSTAAADSVVTVSPLA